MDLKTRFVSLWQRLEASGSSDCVFDSLIALYQEPHRRYHNVGHLSFGLTQLDLLANLAEHPNWVEFAFYYHDSVYVIGADDSEEQSARLAINVLRKARVSGGAQVHIGAYIMATKPGQEPKTVDEQIISDIDLAILGQPRSDFVEYERQVREEYESVPEQVFWRFRKEILSTFLERLSIFSTSRFRNLYEEQARENLAWTIEQH